MNETKSEDDHRKIYGQSTRACLGLGLLTSHPSQKGWGGGAPRLQSTVHREKEKRNERASWFFGKFDPVFNVF